MDNKKKQLKNIKSICRVPTKNEEISANWKKLRKNIAENSNESNRQQSKKENKTQNNKINIKNIEDSKIWFDGVDKCLIESSKVSSMSINMNEKLCKQKSFVGLTRYVAMDCEMVGTGFGGNNSVLARVSIVNLFGHCIYDKFVEPIEEVTDYRTEVSGIRPENLQNAENFKTVQKEVYDIIKNRILIGHSIVYDLKVLFLSHPKNMIRDTSSYFRRFFNNRTPSLKKLSDIYLGIQIQNGEHDSVIDAKVTMRLYTLFKKKWENSISKLRHQNFDKKQKTCIIEKI